jgi:hypothetical protein
VKHILRIIAVIFFVFSFALSCVLFFYYWLTLSAWLGRVLGLIVAILVTPGAFVFPLVYWVVERAFPVFYFELLAGGIVSVLVGRLLWRASQ